MTAITRRMAWLSIGVAFVLLVPVVAIQAQPAAKGDKDGQGMMGGMQ